MKRSRFVSPLLVISIAAVSFWVSSSVRRAQAVSAGGSPWIPYQIEIKLYAATDRAHPALAADLVEAVRADGSSAESAVYYRADGSIYQRGRMLSLQGGIRIRADDGLGLMTATRNPGADNAAKRSRLDPAQSCAVSMDGSGMKPDPVISQEEVQGYQTFKISVDHKRYRRTSWRAPALGCAEIRALAEKIDESSGSVVATSERTAVEIRRGDPDASLFQIPTGLRNVSPSELASARAEAGGAKLKESEVTALQTSDETFRTFRFDP